MDSDTFDLLPITVNPATKAVTVTSASNSQSATPLEAEIAYLNKIHKTFTSLDTPAGVPPPPMPFNPKRSAQIGKLRDTGNTALKKNNFDDALKMYSLGIEMARTRDAWEPQGLVREELATLYSNRSQVWLAKREWAQAYVDAEISVEMKKPQNGKAWWRGGKALLEMNRYQDAAVWMTRALEFEAGGQAQENELQSLKKEADNLLKKHTNA